MSAVTISFLVFSAGCLIFLFHHSLVIFFIALFLLIGFFIFRTFCILLALAIAVIYLFFHNYSYKEIFFSNKSSLRKEFPGEQVIKEVKEETQEKLSKNLENIQDELTKIHNKNK